FFRAALGLVALLPLAFAGLPAANATNPYGGSPVVQFAFAGYTVNESAPEATITVVLSAASALEVKVNYTSYDGTAKAPTDYQAVKGTLTFAPGEVIKTFTVPIVDDAIYEFDETVNLALSDPINATLGLYEASLTILDNDAPLTVQFDSASYTVAENGGKA